MNFQPSHTHKVCVGPALGRGRLAWNRGHKATPLWFSTLCILPSSTKHLEEAIFSLTSLPGRIQTYLRAVFGCHGFPKFSLCYRGFICFSESPLWRDFSCYWGDPVSCTSSTHSNILKWGLAVPPARLNMCCLQFLLTLEKVRVPTLWSIGTLVKFAFLPWVCLPWLEMGRLTVRWYRVGQKGSWHGETYQVLRGLQIFVMNLSLQPFLWSV